LDSFAQGAIGGFDFREKLICRNAQTVERFYGRALDVVIGSDGYLAGR
jgi:hypothetical protein